MLGVSNTRSAPCAFLSVSIYKCLFPPGCSPGTRCRYGCLLHALSSLVLNHVCSPLVSSIGLDGKMSSYYTEKHRHSRRRELPVAGTVMRRVEVRRPSLEKSPPPAPAAPSVKEPPKEPKEESKEEPKEASKEKEVASPPAPEWSKWEPIEGAGWDGHWRAKAIDDGEWHPYIKGRGARR